MTHGKWPSSSVTDILLESVDGEFTVLDFRNTPGRKPLTAGPRNTDELPAVMSDLLKSL